MELPDLFITRLEDALNRRGDGRRYRVINGGTSAYSNDQELIFFETEGRKYGPDVVILLVCLNDIWHNIRTHYGSWAKPVFKLEQDQLVLTNSPAPKFVIPPIEPAKTATITSCRELTVPAIKEWLNDNSRIYAFARRTVKNSEWLYRAAVKLGLAHKTEAPDMPPLLGILSSSPLPEEYKVWHKTLPPVIERAWDVTEAILARLRQKVESSGAQLLVFYIPDKGSVEEEAMRTTKRNYGLTDELFDLAKPGKDIKGICERLSIRCIDPIEQFREEAIRLEKQGKELHFRFDGHWSVEGNQFVARLLQEYLEANFLNQQSDPNMSASPLIGGAGRCRGGSRAALL